jgi:MFS family permease
LPTLSTMPSILSVAALSPHVSQAASAMTKRTVSAGLGSDRDILRLFAVLVGVSIVGSALLHLRDDGTDYYGLVSSVLGGISMSFLVVGVPAYFQHRRRSLTPRKTVLRWMVIISAAMTAVMISSIALAALYAPDLVQFDGGLAGEFLVGMVLMVPALFIVDFALCVFLLLIAFGVIGVLTALERRYAGRALRQIARLSPPKRFSLVDRAVKWLFDIPDVLDTKTLSVSPQGPRTRVSISDLRAPVMWQLIFGFVLGIYISFNPFVSDRSPETLLGLFSLLTSASILFPFIILPWFLFRRLGAGISGQTKEFTLYNGIRSRVFQSYFAIGTIVILVRLSIQEIAVALESFVFAFAAFMGTLLMSATVTTYVYLNYFENALTEDVVEGLTGTEVRVIGLGAAEQSGSSRVSDAERAE